MPDGTPEDTVPEGDERDDMLYMAWTIIANVSEGDWSRQQQEWQDAATRWRDQWHRYLSLTR